VHSFCSAENSADIELLSILLFDCEGLRFEGNFVCGLELVLPTRRHCQLGVCFCDPKVACAVQAEEAFHGTEALLNPELAFGIILLNRFSEARSGRFRAAFLMIPSLCLPRKLARLALDA